MPTTRILVVCLGNICRSPTAEAALKEAATEAGIDLDVRSAGTGDWHVGCPPDARMRKAAAAEGLEIGGHAEQVSPAALRTSDLVLAMDQQNLADLQALASVQHIATPVRLFRDFDPEASSGAEVPDPYFGGQEGFAEVVAMVRRTARALIQELAARRS